MLLILIRMTYWITFQERGNEEHVKIIKNVPVNVGLCSLSSRKP